MVQTWTRSRTVLMFQSDFRTVTWTNNSRTGRVRHSYPSAVMQSEHYTFGRVLGSVPEAVCIKLWPTRFYQLTANRSFSTTRLQITETAAFFFSFGLRFVVLRCMCLSLRKKEVIISLCIVWTSGWILSYIYIERHARFQIFLAEAKPWEV